MITPLRYWLILAFPLLAANGCRDEKPHNATTRVATPVAHDSASDTHRIANDSSPSAVILRYYDAIQNGQYDSAYSLWGQSGEASGKTRAEFAAGFAQTERTTATVGDSVRIEGAAGSQYATVPVTVDAVLRSGARQHFTGTITLRRAMVDGATPEQRAWHIFAADLHKQ